VGARVGTTISKVFEHCILDSYADFLVYKLVIISLVSRRLVALFVCDLFYTSSSAVADEPARRAASRQSAKF